MGKKTTKKCELAEYLSLLYIFFLLPFSGKANDSTVYKTFIEANLGTEFFHCQRNLFHKFLDNIKADNSGKINAVIEIVINKNIVEFQTPTSSITYRLICKSDTLIQFESKERHIARVTSICTRERYTYYLKIERDSKMITLFYDMAKHKKPDVVVFKGKLESAKQIEY